MSIKIEKTHVVNSTEARVAANAAVRWMCHTYELDLLPLGEERVFAVEFALAELFFDARLQAFHSEKGGAL